MNDYCPIIVTITDTTTDMQTDWSLLMWYGSLIPDDPSGSESSDAICMPNRLNLTHWYWDVSD